MKSNPNMRDQLPNLIFLAGVLQLLIPIASALVPLRLKWRTGLSSIPKLHRQLYWTYGGYVVLAIVAFALICLFNAKELAAGSGLARGVCGYMAAFWGIRLCLQAVFDVKPFLTEWWLVLGYHTLTVVFVTLTAIFGLAAIWPAP